MIDNADPTPSAVHPAAASPEDHQDPRALLLASEERLRVALEAGRMGTWEWSIPTSRVVWSPNLEALHGRAPGSFKGTFEDVLSDVDPEDHQRLINTVQTALSQRTNYQIEYRIRTLQGELRWVEARAKLFCDADGQPLRMVGVCMDVTDRKRSEEAVRQSERQMRLITDALPALIAYVDRDQRYLFNSRAYEQWIGQSCPSLRGKRIRDVATSESVYERLRPHIEKALAGELVRFPSRMTYPDGITRDVEVTYSPDIDAGGQVNGFAVLVVDVSDRKRAEAERERLLASEREAREEAERISRLKDEFLATLSHELRTPLNAIVGWSQILRGGRHTADDLAMGLQTIERNAHAQTHIIEDLLDMSRIISGKLRLHLQRVDVREVLQSALETIRPAADAKQIALNLSFDPAENNANLLLADPNRLRQVLWNLLTNAVKFTPKGGWIQVHMNHRDSQLHICVRDSGEGIEPAFLPHVFDRFRQGDASTTRRHGGLGLGLAITKTLVEIHGGSIEAHSRGQGLGALFTVSLPLRAVLPEKETSAAPKDLPHEGLAPASDGAANISLQGVRVLVVDDEPDARLLIKRVLEQAQAVVHVVGSAIEAMEQIGRQLPDILVSDVGMPETDGYWLIRQLRRLDPRQGGKIPALALTAYARPEERLRILRAGFQMHTAKPIDSVELTTIVASLAGRIGTAH